MAENGIDHLVNHDSHENGDIGGYDNAGFTHSETVKALRLDIDRPQVGKGQAPRPSPPPTNCPPLPNGHGSLNDDDRCSSSSMNGSAIVNVDDDVNLNTDTTKELVKRPLDEKLQNYDNDAKMLNSDDGHLTIAIPEPNNKESSVGDGRLLVSMNHTQNLANESPNDDDDKEKIPLRDMSSLSDAASEKALEAEGHQDGHHQNGRTADDYCCPRDGDSNDPTVPNDKMQQGNGAGYDEYFIPVNTHKKYLRGEKLYLTKDSKKICKSWRRIIICGLIFIVVAVAILVGVLSATGILIAESESKNMRHENPPTLPSVSIAGSLAVGPSLTSNKRQQTSKSSTSMPSIEHRVPTTVNSGTSSEVITTVPTQRNPPQSQTPVPNALVGEFVITNENFTEDLRDNSSFGYMQLKTHLEDELIRIFKKTRLRYKEMKILGFSPGSIKVKLVLIWDPNSLSVPAEQVEYFIRQQLKSRADTILAFKVDPSKLDFRDVVNGCLVENGGCSQGCYYDYYNLTKSCTCGDGMELDADGTTCVTSKHQLETTESPTATVRGTTESESDNSRVTSVPPETSPEFLGTNASAAPITRPATTTTPPPPIATDATTIETTNEATGRKPMIDQKVPDDITTIVLVSTTPSPAETRTPHVHDHNLHTFPEDATTTTTMAPMTSSEAAAPTTQNIDSTTENTDEVMTNHSDALTTTTDQMMTTTKEFLDTEPFTTLSTDQRPTTLDSVTKVSSNTEVDVVSNDSITTPPESSSVSETVTVFDTTVVVTTPSDRETASSTPTPSPKQVPATSFIEIEIGPVDENVVESSNTANSTSSTKTSTITTTTTVQPATLVDDVVANVTEAHQITSTSPAEPETVFPTTIYDMIATTTSIPFIDTVSKLVTTLMEQVGNVTTSLSTITTGPVTEQVTPSSENLPNLNMVTDSVIPEAVTENSNVTESAPSTRPPNSSSPLPTTAQPATTETINREEPEPAITETSESVTDATTMQTDSVTLAPNTAVPGDTKVSTTLEPVAMSTLTTPPPVDVSLTNNDNKSLVNASTETQDTTTTAADAGENFTTPTESTLIVTLISMDNREANVNANPTEAPGVTSTDTPLVIVINGSELDPNSTDSEANTTEIVTTDSTATTAPDYTTTMTVGDATVFDNSTETTFSPDIIIPDEFETNATFGFNDSIDTTETGINTEDVANVTDDVDTTTETLVSTRADDTTTATTTEMPATTTTEISTMTTTEILTTTTTEIPAMTTTEILTTTTTEIPAMTTTEILTTTTTEIPTTTELMSTTPNATEMSTVAGIECRKDQFLCTLQDRDVCFNNTFLCDGIYDCDDKSDESNCTDSCMSNFKCVNSSSCVTSVAQCDGIWDCDDGTDEDNCTPSDCAKHEVMCSDGSFCIKPGDICDWKYNCHDRSDEVGCVERTTCETGGRFFCNDGLCIPWSLKCDGENDCKDREDEGNCTCTDDDFHCNDGRCLKSSTRCDGHQDCINGEDEMGCVSVDEQGLVLAYDTFSSSWSLVCADDWNLDYGHYLCQELGFGHALSTEMHHVSFNGTWMTMKRENLTASSLWTERVTYAESCSSNLAAAVTCQEFDCGDYATLLHRRRKRHTKDMSLPYQRKKRQLDSSSSPNSQWPFMAYTSTYKSSKGCLAEILTPVWLITSMECLISTGKEIQNGSDWYVRTNLAKGLNSDMARNHEVLKIIPHPHSSKFRSLTLRDYDVALIRLRHALVFNEKVGAICLPEEQVSAGITCFSGFLGQQMPRAPPPESPTLNSLALMVLDLDFCNQPEQYNGNVNKRMLCTKNSDNQQLCDNDVGTPLMCLSGPNKWYLAGMLTYQRYCNVLNWHPAIFSNLYSMKEFTDQVMGKKHYNVKYDPNMYVIEPPTTTGPPETMTESIATTTELETTTEMATTTTEPPTSTETTPVATTTVSQYSTDSEEQARSLEGMVMTTTTAEDVTATGNGTDVEYGVTLAPEFDSYMNDSMENGSSIFRDSTDATTISNELLNDTEFLSFRQPSGNTSVPEKYSKSLQNLTEALNDTVDGKNSIDDVSGSDYVMLERSNVTSESLGYEISVEDTDEANNASTTTLEPDTTLVAEVENATMVPAQYFTDSLGNTTSTYPSVETNDSTDNPYTPSIASGKPIGNDTSDVRDESRPTTATLISLVEMLGDATLVSNVSSPESPSGKDAPVADALKSNDDIETTTVEDTSIRPELRTSTTVDKEYAARSRNVVLSAVNDSDVEPTIADYPTIGVANVEENGELTNVSSSQPPSPTSEATTASTDASELVVTQLSTGIETTTTVATKLDDIDLGVPTIRSSNTTGPITTSTSINNGTDNVDLSERSLIEPNLSSNGTENGYSCGEWKQNLNDSYGDWPFVRLIQDIDTQERCLSAIISAGYAVASAECFPTNGNITRNLRLLGDNETVVVDKTLIGNSSVNNQDGGSLLLLRFSNNSLPPSSVVCLPEEDRLHVNSTCVILSFRTGLEDVVEIAAVEAKVVGECESSGNAMLPIGADMCIELQKNELGGFCGDQKEAIVMCSDDDGRWTIHSFINDCFNDEGRLSRVSVLDKKLDITEIISN